MTTFEHVIMENFKAFVFEEKNLSLDFRTHVFLDNQYGGTPSYSYSDAEAVIDALYAYLTLHYVDHADRMNRSMDIEALRSAKLNDFLLCRLTDEISPELFYAVKGGSPEKVMEIINIQLADYDDDDTTVKVIAVDVNGLEVSFCVQTTDGLYRSSMGCWISTFDETDIDFDDYPLFDINKIINDAEQFLKSLHELSYVEPHIYIKTKIDTGECEVLEENASYINADSSPYTPKWQPLGKFSCKDDALSFIANK